MRHPQPGRPPGRHRAARRQQQPLIDRRAFENMRGALAEVDEAGGKTHGGERITRIGGENAYYVRPALCEMPEQTGPVLRETFAPILYTMRYRELDEAIRLQPDYAEAHMNLAILLYAKAGPGASAYHFERALHYRPDYGLAHYNYALMLNSAGNQAVAKNHLKQAAASPDHAIRDAALRLLAQLESRK